MALARESISDLLGNYLKVPCLEQPRLKQETGVTQAHTVPTIPITIPDSPCPPIQVFGLGTTAPAAGRGSWHRKRSCALLCSDLSHTACSFLLHSKFGEQ